MIYFSKKSWLKFIFVPIFFFIFLALFYLSYNQNGNIFAQEDATKTRLLCGKEIPSGESFEQSADLMKNLAAEIKSLNDSVSRQIQAAQKMINSSSQCDLGNCSPVCSLSKDCRMEETDCPKDEKGPCYKEVCEDRCDAQGCTSPWGGAACPQSQIEDYFSEGQESFNNVKKSAGNFISLIDGKTEPLCDKINSDIISPGEKTNCELCAAGEISCPKITEKELIQRKLNKARNEFDKCYIPPSDFEKVARGEISGKVLLNCEGATLQGLPRETKTETNGAPACTSLHNYFCCY